MAEYLHFRSDGRSTGRTEIIACFRRVGVLSDLASLHTSSSFDLSRRIVVEVVVLASNLCGVGLRRGALPSIGHDNIRMLQCCEC